MKMPLALVRWLSGVRLYLAIGIGLISLQVWWWSSIAYAGTPDLMASRMHEAYGWLSLAVLAVTLAVGPVYKIAPGFPGGLMMRDSRRMLGIGAAWFAVLHGMIAYFASLEAVNPFDLSTMYRQGFFLGLAALFILGVLALTSSNKAIRGMGRWWFRVQRLVYLAVLLAVWHAFTVGVHAASLTVLAIVIGTIMLLFIGHVHLTLQSDRPSRWQFLALCAAFLALVAISNYGFQQYIDQNSLLGHGHR